jgi:hypothetical protein
MTYISVINATESRICVSVAKEGSDAREDVDDSYFDLVSSGGRDRWRRHQGQTVRVKRGSLTETPIYSFWVEVGDTFTVRENMLH